MLQSGGFHPRKIFEKFEKSNVEFNTKIKADCNLSESIELRSKLKLPNMEKSKKEKISLSKNKRKVQRKTTT